jgi:hypothetical protein
MSEFSAASSAGFAKPESWSIDLPIPQGSASHNEVLQNFTNAILHGSPLIAPAAEGIRSIELANAILLSSWKNQSISLPMDSAEYEQQLLHRINSSTHIKKTPPPRTISQDDFAKSFK